MIVPILGVAVVTVNAWNSGGARAANVHLVGWALAVKEHVRTFTVHVTNGANRADVVGIWCRISKTIAPSAVNSADNLRLDQKNWILL